MEENDMFEFDDAYTYGSERNFEQMRPSSVKIAKIEVVLFNELNIGDIILWSIFRGKIISIKPKNRHKPLVIELIDVPESPIFELEKYNTYSRIIEYEMKD